MVAAHEHPAARTFVVALTGGIASGKTAVSNRFKELGVPVIDTDVIAHQVVEPGQPALSEIQSQFGEELILPDGKLDRRSLRNRIFSDSAAKEKLERILHPAIRARVQQEIAAVTRDYCIVVIPLFTETGAYDWVDRVLVVDTTEETQVNRLMGRDAVSEHQAREALAAQASRQERLALADDVIANNGALDELDETVRQLHGHYQDLARMKSGDSLSKYRDDRNR
jgi:dephospho-CoA kinase